MVFLDANILLEIILKNRTKMVKVESYLSSVNEPTAISMLSAHLIMYFGRKEKAENEFLEGVIEENELLALLPEDYEWAIKNEKRKDFEDALQLSIATRSGCNTFVTLDNNLAKSYIDLPINIISI